MSISFRGPQHYRRPLQAHPTALEKIGRGVLRLRLYRRMSQKTLEERSGVDQSTISRLEHGRHPGITIYRLAAVLDALGVGEVEFHHPELVSEPTDLEIMLYGDPWGRAVREADRRLDWPPA